MDISSRPRSTNRTIGRAGVRANSQLTLPVDHLMKVNQGCREDRYWDSSS
jgi:hypothetical protein